VQTFHLPLVGIVYAFVAYCCPTAATVLGTSRVISRFTRK
jgi:hypothetical protein